MGDTWDKIKNKTAEIKGEVKNEYEHLKEDVTGKDYSDDAAYRRGERQARSGITGAAVRDEKDRATDAIKDTDAPIRRNFDGSVNTDAAEMRGKLKNEAKHQNKEEQKGFNDKIDDMKG